MAQMLNVVVFKEDLKLKIAAAVKDVKLNGSLEQVRGQIIDNLKNAVSNAEWEALSFLSEDDLIARAIKILLGVGLS